MLVILLLVEKKRAMHSFVKGDSWDSTSLLSSSNPMLEPLLRDVLHGSALSEQASGDGGPGVN